VTRFCRSCDICQRTIAKGRVPSIPLRKMPIIDTPIERVAVDILIGLKSDKSDVKVNSELTEEQRGEVMKVLKEFQDVFTDVPGLTNLGEHLITLTTEEPIHSRPYLLPHSMQKEVEKELDDMLKLGIIEPSTSSYSSPIVVVHIPDGSNRVCVDFRKLNKVTVFDPEPMPQPEQVFAKLENDQYFCTFDFYSARNARIASTVLAMAIPSVCLSVRPSHAGIVSKRRHVARCSLHRWIAKCV